MCVQIMTSEKRRVRVQGLRFMNMMKHVYRITLMMAVIVGTFVLCWLPFALMFFLAPIRYQSFDFVSFNMLY